MDVFVFSGLLVKQSWSTDNTLTTDASAEAPLNIEGLTLGVENTFQPNSKYVTFTHHPHPPINLLNIEGVTLGVESTFQPNSKYVTPTPTQQSQQ